MEERSWENERIKNIFRGKIFKWPIKTHAHACQPAAPPMNVVAGVDLRFVLHARQEFPQYFNATLGTLLR